MCICPIHVSYPWSTLHHSDSRPSKYRHLCHASGYLARCPNTCDHRSNSRRLLRWFYSLASSPHTLIHHSISRSLCRASSHLDTLLCSCCHRPNIQHRFQFTCHSSSSLHILLHLNAYKLHTRLLNHSATSPRICRHQRARIYLYQSLYYFPTRLHNVPPPPRVKSLVPTLSHLLAHIPCRLHRR